MAAMGLKLEEQQDADMVECYPDNWQALHVFRALATQWRVSESGYVSGLRYEVVPGVMSMMGIKKKDRAELFNSLREMEDEALNLFNKKNG